MRARLPICRRGVTPSGGEFCCNAASAWQLFPDLYRKRLAEIREDEVEVVMHIPVFIYDGVPLPGQPMELVFFEHRYITMVDRCLQGSRKFGYMAPDDATTGVLMDMVDVQRETGGKFFVRAVAKRCVAGRQVTWPSRPAQHAANIGDVE